VSEMPSSEIKPGAGIGFVGLGKMGYPMSRRLAEAGYRVRGYDVSEAGLRSWAERVPGASAAAGPAAAADGAAAVVLMLPDSAVVTSVLADVLPAMRPGAVVVDMSSSQPASTRSLALAADERGVALVDAPVSGGVSGAERGSLTIMAGGPADGVRRVRPLLDVLGSRILHVGGAGAGHAVKALNNLLSAIHLLATSEAMAAAAAFGLDVPRVLDAINTSSGRSGSTENKWPNFILPGTFDSGFALRLMLKDMRIALGIAESAGTRSRLSAAAVELWAEAAGDLPADADHTEIARWLDPGLSRRLQVLGGDLAGHGLAEGGYLGGHPGLVVVAGAGHGFVDADDRDAVGLGQADERVGQ
jgi:3-hydroxyisobutyrate dehydrogenase